MRPPAETVKVIARRLLARGEWLAVAESCTGGLLAECLTRQPGSSGWFERGVVTYSNRAKCELLGVPATVLARQGAVSGATAKAMAAGLLRKARVDLAVGITGIAGPAGGTAAKPVGLVWIAWAKRDGQPRAKRYRFGGGRAAVRRQAVQAALEGLLEMLERG